MEDTARPESKSGKILKLLLKIVITAACLWYVSGKIDFSKAGAALASANWLFLFFALLAFILSKIFSAFRLNIYFRNINIHLSEWNSIKLYWLGMFYNLFLPGSISGDAYKVILLSRRYTISYKKTTSAVLLDRFSGLLGLGCILAAYSTFVIRESLYVGGIVLGALLAIAVFYFVIRKWFRDFLPSFWPTLFWGIAVQATQVVAVYLIMHALHVTDHETQYIFLFLLSSVMAVLPLTIGGLGAREIVFLEGSRYFGLLQEHSVIISILFYLITLFTSAWGLIYVFRSPIADESVKENPAAKL